jgi:hypothetical protein
LFVLLFERNQPVKQSGLIGVGRSLFDARFGCDDLSRNKVIWKSTSQRVLMKVLSEVSFFISLCDGG